MRVVLSRRERGYYQLDDNGLPLVTVFLSEDRVEALEDPEELAVVLISPSLRAAERPLEES